MALLKSPRCRPERPRLRLPRPVFDLFLDERSNLTSSKRHQRPYMQILTASIQPPKLSVPKNFSGRPKINPGVGLPGCLLMPWFAVQGASARAIDHRSWTEAAADLRETTLIPSRCPADCEDGFTARYLHTPNQQEGGCCLCPEAPGGPPPRAPAHTKIMLSKVVQWSSWRNF